MLKKYANSETINKNWQFYCEKCDYGCNKKFLFSQHLKTKKHLKQKCSNNAQKNMQEHLCCEKCGKQYKHIQSYKRHVRKCVILAETPPKCENVVVSDSNSMIEHEVDIEKQELRNMVTTLITQNQAMLMENKEMREMVHDMLPKIGSNNTTINNRFNLQVFLNEKCKDAINLSEFVESLQLELGDLENTTQVGFVGGVAKIFVKGLRELDLHKRPIHCSDLKRDVLYVRDNDTWKKDSDNNKHVKAAINTVAKKQISSIKEWEDKNPDWNKTEEGTEQYIKMVRHVTGSSDDNTIENKIIKSIAKEVAISKDIIP